MGYNTTLVVLNDALHQIENDPAFGKKLVEAIHRQVCTNERQDISAGNHANAAHVVEQHHADHTVIIAVGGNLGTVIGHAAGWRNSQPEEQDRILRQLAEQRGYRLCKKPVRKPKKEPVDADAS